MCFNGRTIMVPRCDVEAMKESGAICGDCSDVCCPDQPGPNVDMCLNGRTINVNRNACPGIKRAGGVCGKCPEPTPTDDNESALSSKAKSKPKET